MGRYDNLVREVEVVKRVFIPGKFTCAKGSYKGSQGLLQVELSHIDNKSAEIIIGPDDNSVFTVNKETALVLSNFFRELSESLE